MILNYFFQGERKKGKAIKNKTKKQTGSDERCSLDEIKTVGGKSQMRLDRLQPVGGLKLEKR